MQMVNLPLDQLQEAPWNPNQMDEPTLARLRESLTRYGLVQNLVVRPLEEDSYEVLSGNQRLQVLREIHTNPVPCVIVDLDDAQARLLGQALNRIQGEDDLGMRAELLKEILSQVSAAEVVKILPETVDSLNAFASLGQQDLAGYLQNWEQAQQARLKHLAFQLLPGQMEVVLARLLPLAREAQSSSPNARGTALYLLCLGFLERGEKRV